MTRYSYFASVVACAASMLAACGSRSDLASIFDGEELAPLDAGPPHVDAGRVAPDASVVIVDDPTDAGAEPDASEDVVVDPADAAAPHDASEDVVDDPADAEAPRDASEEGVEEPVDAEADVAPPPDSAPPEDAVAPPPDSLPPIEHLVGHWTFDEGTGAVAHDSSVNELHGTVTGGRWVGGVSGIALEADGDMVVDVADAQVLQLTESFTLEAWVRAVPGVHRTHGMIIFRGDNRPGLDSYLLSIEPGDVIQCSIQDASNAAATVVAPMPTGRFVFVVATLDDLTGWLRLYLDGVLVSEINTPIRSLGPLDSTQGPGVGFGGHANRSPGSYALHGAIDEIRILSRALTPVEIALRYTEISAP